VLEVPPVSFLDSEFHVLRPPLAVFAPPLALLLAPRARQRRIERAEERLRVCVWGGVGRWDTVRFGRGMRGWDAQGRVGGGGAERRVKFSSGLTTVGASVAWKGHESGRSRVIAPVRPRTRARPRCCTACRPGVARAKSGTSWEVAVNGKVFCGQNQKS
jgi:hypothetical protein